MDDSATEKHADNPGAGVPVSPPRAPQWVKVMAVVAALVVAGLVAASLLSGGEHGPGRHMPGGDATEHSAPVEGHSP